MIGYVPDDSTFKTVHGLQPFHKISVTINRPGLHVRPRTGFLGIPDEDTKPPAPQTRPEQLLAALKGEGSSPLDIAGVIAFASKRLERGTGMNPRLKQAGS